MERERGYGMAYQKTIILLSGPIGSGKTTLAMYIERNHAACCVSTATVMSAVVGRDLNRRELQQIGLERRFLAGEWIADEVIRSARDHPAVGAIIVDAVRTVE